MTSRQLIDHRKFNLDLRGIVDNIIVENASGRNLLTSIQRVLFFCTDPTDPS